MKIYVYWVIINYMDVAVIFIGHLESTAKMANEYDNNYA